MYPYPKRPITPYNSLSPGTPKNIRFKDGMHHDVTGECKDMLTQECFKIPFKAFHDTELAGIHDTIMPPPKSFASKLLGLVSRLALHDNKTPMNTKVKHSYLAALPLRFHSALQKRAVVFQGKSPFFGTSIPITSITGASTLATEPLDLFPMLFHPNFLASLFAILCTMINSCIVP